MLLYVLFALLFCTGFGFAAFGQCWLQAPVWAAESAKELAGGEPAGWNQKVVIDAEHVEFNAAKRLVHAAGEVRAERGEFAIEADAVLYRVDAEVLEARGNVVLRGEEVLRGELLSYDLRENRASFASASGRTEQVEFTGEWLEFADGSHTVEGAWVTPCTSKRPHYHLTAKRVEITPGDRLVAHHPSVWIRGVELFRLPRYSVSLRPGETGSPLPDFGFDSRDGAYLALAHRYRLADGVLGSLLLRAATRMGYEAVAGIDYRPAEHTLLAGELGYHAREGYSAELIWEPRPDELGVYLYADQTSAEEGLDEREGSWSGGVRVDYERPRYALLARYALREEVDEKTYVDVAPEIGVELKTRTLAEMREGGLGRITASGGLSYAGFAASGDSNSVTGGRTEGRLELGYLTDQLFADLELGLHLQGALRDYAQGERQHRTRLGVGADYSFADSGTASLSYTRTLTGGDTPLEFDRWEAGRRFGLGLEYFWSEGVGRQWEFDLEVDYDLDLWEFGGLDVNVRRYGAAGSYPYWDLAVDSKVDPHAGRLRGIEVELERVFDCFSARGSYAVDFEDEERYFELGVEVHNW